MICETVQARGRHRRDRVQSRPAAASRVKGPAVGQPAKGRLITISLILKNVNK